MKDVVFHPKKCLNCRSCMIACSFNNIGECSLTDSCLQINTNSKEECLLTICVECDEKYCIEACPVQAIQERYDDIYYVNKEICIGCGACVDACPHNGIWISHRDGKAIKCDMCGGDPSCIKVCMPKALSIKE